jgi:predicted nucleic acid-binding protein
MTTFVDTSVLIPLFDGNSPHHGWCQQQIESADPPLVISDVVYTEVSVGMATKAETDTAIAQFGFVRAAYSDDVLFRAGRAFLAYKANQGPKDSLLPDFFVGAHAEVSGETLLTRDPGKVRTYFPTVPLITPP